MTWTSSPSKATSAGRGLPWNITGDDQSPYAPALPKAITSPVDNGGSGVLSIITSSGKLRQPKTSVGFNGEFEWLVVLMTMGAF